MTPSERERLRREIYRHKPWRFSTGPQTPEGKARVAENGRRHQKKRLSVPEQKRLRADVEGMLEKMAAVRRLVG